MNALDRLKSVLCNADNVVCVGGTAEDRRIIAEALEELAPLVAAGPDWSKAPDWARWAAMDDDGSWYWYKRKPKCIRGCFIDPEDDSAAIQRTFATDFRKTLQRKPAAAKSR